jgi:predicted outer membrane lipoprotein
VHPNLSFEQAPPIGVPLRFLLTAPWFGVAAGLLLAWSGETAVASRWTPHALAIVHLLVAGYLLQAMSGALFQFVPVAAGGNVWRPRLVAGVLHPALALAAVTLATGLFLFDGVLLRIAAGLFAMAVTFQVVVVGTALWRTPARGPTIVALRLAVAGLAVTITLGLSLAEGLAGDHPWPMATITGVHAAWGLGGWILMLVLGVSYFVVPMFQLTPPYPAAFARRAPWVLVALLGLWSLQLLASPGWLEPAWPAGLLVAAAYAALTLWLQQHRRRRISDPTFLFFRGAMACLLAAFVSALAMAVVPAVGDQPRSAWWLGVLLIPGAFVSVINGMAYKIVPFLCWLHLQRLVGIGGTVPNMRDVLGEREQRGQLRLHFAAVLLLAVSAFLPGAAAPAGAAFAASSAWLGWNLANAVRRYRGFRSRVSASAANPGS